jgi:hypothetical protein
VQPRVHWPWRRNSITTSRNQKKWEKHANLRVQAYCSVRTLSLYEDKDIEPVVAVSDTDINEHYSHASFKRQEKEDWSSWNIFTPRFCRPPGTQVSCAPRHPMQRKGVALSECCL